MPIVSGQALIPQQISEWRRKLGILSASMFAGGMTGDVLSKASNANYDFVWSPLLGGLVLAGNGIVFSGGNTVNFAQAGAYTAGAVPFATGAATMGFDAASLFWDDANDFFGIGTAVPAGRLHVVQAYADASGTFMSRHNATQTTSGGVKRAFYASFETIGAGNFIAGLNSAGIFESLHSGSGDVSTAVLHIGCEIYHGKSAAGTGNMDGSIGLSIQSLNQNVVGTVGAAYDIFIQTPITTGTITNNYAIWQNSPSAFSFFAGNVSIGTPTFSNLIGLRVERTLAETGAGVNVWNIYNALTNSSNGVSTASNFVAGFFRTTTEGSQLYQGAVGTVCISADSVHNGSAQCDYVSGVRAFSRKTNTGVVATAYAVYAHCRNENATGAINTAYSLYAVTPIVTGAITTYYGLYLSAGAGTTVYGIAQAGTTDLNYLAGFSAFGSSAAVNTTFALFGASTAAISSQRILRGSAAYAGTVEGDYWNDFTQKCLIGHIDGLKQFDSRVMFVATADKTVTNTNAETTMFAAGIGTLTFPADFFVVGKSVRITLRGHHTMDASPPTLTFRVKLGGVTFASVVYTDLNDTNQYLEVSFILTCRTTGAGGTGIGQGYVLMHEQTGGSASADIEQLVMTATAAMNTTGTLALDVTAQPSVADAGSTFTITNAIVEVIA
jgi:hypothetical protein